MYLILQHIFKQVWVLLIGLLGCLLPIQQMVVGGNSYLTFVTDNYSTYSILLLLLLFAFYTMLKLRQAKPVYWVFEGLLGIYLIGWVIFMTYRTFMLFSSKISYSLANQLDANSFPREGSILILISGVLLVYKAVIKQKQ